MNVTIKISKVLSEDQKEELLAYYHYNDIKSRKIEVFHARANTNKGALTYYNIQFEIDKDVWKSRGSDLSDIFQEGNYTIEDTVLPAK